MKSTPTYSPLKFTKSSADDFPYQESLIADKREPKALQIGKGCRLRLSAYIIFISIIFVAVIATVLFLPISPDEIKTDDKYEIEIIPPDPSFSIIDITDKNIFENSNATFYYQCYNIPSKKFQNLTITTESKNFVIPMVNNNGWYCRLVRYGR